MFFIKSAYCRLFQAAFRMALPVLPYREPEIINSCSEIGKVLEKEKATSVLVVTDKGIGYPKTTYTYEDYYSKYIEKLLGRYIETPIPKLVKFVETLIEKPISMRKLTMAYLQKNIFQVSSPITEIRCEIIRR